MNNQPSASYTLREVVESYKNTGIIGDKFDRQTFIQLTSLDKRCERFSENYINSFLQNSANDFGNNKTIFKHKGDSEYEFMH